MGHEYFQRETENFAAALARLREHPGRRAPDDVLAKLESKVAHYRARLRMRQGSRIARLPIVFAELIRGRYFRYSINYKAIGQDLFL